MKKSIENKDWGEIDRLCEENSDSLSLSDVSQWARSKYMLGDFTGCLEKSLAVLSEMPENSDALKFSARAATKLGRRPSEIISRWEEILIREPDNLEANNNVARALLRDGNVSHATKITSKLLATNPDYAPGLTTLEKIRKYTENTSPKGDGDPKLEYRRLYKNGNFSEVVEFLNFPEDSASLSEDQAIFSLRSLSRLGRFKEILDSYSKLSQEVQNSPRIISEISISARELGNHVLLASTISELLKIAKSNATASKHYLRQVIYFEEDEKIAALEIEKMMELHGVEILPYILTQILKSRRLSLFSGIESLGGARSLFDPLNGNLHDSIGFENFSSIIEDFNFEISQAIEMDKSRYTANLESFFIHCDSLDLSYLIPESFSSGQFEKNRKTMGVNGFSVKDLEKYCSIVADHSLKIDLSEKDPDSIFLFSRNINSHNFQNLSLESLHSGKTTIFSITTEKTLLGVATILDKGEEVSLIEESLLTDPRQTLGRFFHLLGDIATSDILVVSWIAQILYNNPPSYIFYDNSLNHIKIAAAILGLSDDFIEEIT